MVKSNCQLLKSNFPLVKSHCPQSLFFVRALHKAGPFKEKNCEKIKCLVLFNYCNFQKSGYSRKSHKQCTRIQCLIPSGENYKNCGLRKNKGEQKTIRVINQPKSGEFSSGYIARGVNKRLISTKNNVIRYENTVMKILARVGTPKMV